MSVALRTSRDLGQLPDGARRISMADGAGVDPSLLEQAFDAAASEWWETGRHLSAEASAILAHTPACVANASDFGLMLAWTHLVKGWAEQPGIVAFICDDPWMFRHLRSLPGVSAGKPPPLVIRAMLLRLRGLAARSAVAVRVGLAACRARGAAPKGGAWLLVYGHPSSRADGTDGYFGDLMQKLPELRRALHVDCPPDRARVLGTSLHGFGNPLFALTLPFARWRTRERFWIVRRAVAREAGTGQGAMIAWQIHCQRRWLARTRPIVVAWPWENHSWERDFVRAARAAGVRTVGYQHSAIGRQMLNYAPRSNPDGPASLPDRVLCSGAGTRDQLARWGFPAERLGIGGALRFQRRAAPRHAKDAPVFVALPFDGATAAEMVEACRRDGRKFLIKDHPMTPFAFSGSNGIARTNAPLEAQKEVSAVLYAATTVGIESVLAGLPTLRFRPRGRIALDIAPPEVKVTPVDAESLGAALDAPPAPEPVDAARIFAPVDHATWREALA